MKMRMVLLMLVGIMLGGLAQAAPAFKEGLQYTLITPPPPQPEGKDVEVIEFFWYGCPHCFALEPHVQTWLKNKPDYVKFERIPAPFSGRAMLHAKTFFALKVMGELDRVHESIFDAMHKQHRKLDTLDEMTAFLKEQGVDIDKFRAAMDSFAVQTQLNRAVVLARRYGINSVPTFIVDGRYKSGKGFKSYGEFTELVDYLAAKTLKERQGAATSN